MDTLIGTLVLYAAPGVIGIICIAIFFWKTRTRPSGNLSTLMLYAGLIFYGVVLICYSLKLLFSNGIKDALVFFLWPQMTFFVLIVHFWGFLVSLAICKYAWDCRKLRESPK